jgi:deoxycytidine triphosphate deaminase
MIRNADYTMSLIVDPTGRAKKAQVGVDLTVASLNKIVGSDLPDPVGADEIGYVYNDASGLKATYGRYLPVEVRDIDGHKMYFLTRGVYSITFEQGLNPLPANNTAFIYQRSTLGRNGVLLRSSVFDPGYTCPTMGAILEVGRPVCIEEGSRVAQIVIYENEKVPDTELYNGRYQNLPGNRNA